MLGWLGEPPGGGDQVGLQLRDQFGVGRSAGLGFGEIVTDPGSEWFEPCRDLTARLQRRLVAVWGSVAVGQLSALCGGRDVGAVAGQDAFEDVAGVAEVAVVGVADAVKGQVPVAFAVMKDASTTATREGAAAMEREIMATVDREIGAIARPSKVCFVTVLPKTRSGKLLRRSIQAICEGRDPGDLTTIEDPGALEQIRNAVG